MIALGIPPGIHRRHFAFEKLKDFDQELFSQIYNDDSGAKELKHRIIGSDISPQAIAIAEKNIRNAGLKKYIDLQVMPFQQYTEAPAAEGVLITNPPYGERVKVDDMDELYSMIGERLKHIFTGYKAYILSYRKESFDAIGLRHSRRFFLYNGELECEMREYEIFSGKRREHPKGNDDRDRPRRYDDLAERNSKEGYRRSQRASKAEEEKPRDETRRKRSHDDRVGTNLLYQANRVSRPPLSDRRNLLSPGNVPHLVAKSDANPVPVKNFLTRMLSREISGKNDYISSNVRQAVSIS
jgi:putative N6-adenine-specific DNA methylase